MLLCLLQLRKATLAGGLLHQLDLSSLLSPELVPVSTSRSRQGPELVSCQVLVAGFVEAQQQLNLHMRGLQDELQAHKDHIGNLKLELNAACKRNLYPEVFIFVPRRLVVAFKIVWFVFVFSV